MDDRIYNIKLIRMVYNMTDLEFIELYVERLTDFVKDNNLVCNVNDFDEDYLGFDFSCMYETDYKLKRELITGDYSKYTIDLFLSSVSIWEEDFKKELIM